MHLVQKKRDITTINHGYYHEIFWALFSINQKPNPIIYSPHHAQKDNMIDTKMIPQWLQLLMKVTSTVAIKN